MQISDQLQCQNTELNQERSKWEEVALGELLEHVDPG